MASDDIDSSNAGTPRFLEPPAVTALRQEARNSAPSSPAPMERTLSEDIREEREDLKEAAEHTLNVIVDLDLDGRIKWVSPSWSEVIGTPSADVEGRQISEIVLDNKNVFEEAVESMKEDDSRSQIVRFSVRLGPSSVFWHDPNSPEEEKEDVPSETETLEDGRDTSSQNILDLEGQGIMVYDRTSGGDSHTMWMLRPSSQPREVTIGLPPLLVESLGVGAEVLANYLTVLAEVGTDDPAHHPPPMPVLCRICERQITPWWFEKHSDLCLQEHRAEMDVQMAQDNLNEHRHSIVKVLDVLESRTTRPILPETQAAATPQAEYKGLPIGPTQSAPGSGLASASSSSSGTPPRSRDPSTSGLGHSRGRSFAIRRPLARIVELVLDLCDTALEISTPALKESRTDTGDEIRTQSPQSESRISQILQWQSPSSNTLDQEQGLAALSMDTEQAARAKVDAVFRHRRIVEYSERIRIEFTVLVEECIDAAMKKAERIVSGDLEDSSSSSDAESGQTESNTEMLPQNYPDESSRPIPIPNIGTPVRVPADQTLGFNLERVPSSVAISTRSSSPMESPTPRSHKSLGALINNQPPSKRGSLLGESDAIDSDSSIPSSALSADRREESPSSERGLSRGASTKDKHRRSLILPGLSSPRRESPARNPPHSPLRLSKPRLSMGESLPSPSTSPHLTSTDLSSYGHMQFPHRHHHRRQSSATSPDLTKPPISPHLSSVSHPPPRAVAPSIKDFEIIKPISKGAFGSVYLSKKKSTAEYFAIKVLKKADMVAKNQVTNVKAERAIMMWQGESDFVAKLYWTFSSKDYLYLVMEYLNGGDCASLVKILGGLSEDWAKKYVAEVILGIEHLHSRGIVHRDLKPDNLLIDQKGHLKLTDFGLSRMGLVGRQKRIQKSPNDSAPDLLKQGPFTRAISLTSSRSASFDFPGTESPNSTPLITPEVGLGQPSYFSLSKDTPIYREPSRRASGYRSDSASSDTLSSMFRGCSLQDSAESSYPMPSSHPQAHQHYGPPRGSFEEELQSEGSDSPHLFPVQSALHPTLSVSSLQDSPSQQQIVPPAMALFDPADHSRCFVGTPDYLAPETIKGVGQDEMSDWWSLGCILFEFLYGYPPFNASTPDEVFENILNRRINWPEEADELVSPESKDLMNKLMTLNPMERLGSNASEKFANGAAEVRAHPWFFDVNWETLLEDEAQFVPAPENPEDTEYFDARGATLQAFDEELEDQISPSGSGSGTSYQDRPHDALYKVRSHVNSMKRGLMPLHIPPHVRDTRSRRLSEPSLADDFGSFNFKNLPVLEKANKDVIQKLRQEAMQAQQRPIPGNTPPNNSSPSLEGSPLLPMPIKRTMSQNKASNRSASPSSLSQPSSSSPSRPSQPSSPLLVQFSTSNHHERRKTSGSSSTLSHTASGLTQPSSAIEAPPRLTTNLKMSASAASSPIKSIKVPVQPENTASLHRQSSAPASRARSHTIGSQDSDLALPKEPFVPGHHKRRSQLWDVSPSSSDNEDPRTKALLKVQRRRQSTRRLSQINMTEGPFFRPLDVLICEDHPVSRLVMETLFEKLRCRTITALNGSEAMRFALSEVQFDIIMTEFKLPQINGADLARMVRDTRSANTHTPIIAVTGYLKDLPETHNFDALIEKPPTLPKLTEALSKFCQWKPPRDDVPIPNPPMSAGLRRPSSQAVESPSSGSSGFGAILTSSYRGSSRADSIASSCFGDLDSVKTDEYPIITSRQPTDEWPDAPGGGGGLGITEDASSKTFARPVVAEYKPQVTPATLVHATSAPPSLHVPGIRTPRKRGSIEGIRAKRESIQKKRFEGAESGDDEDEELGNTQARNKSPPQCSKSGGIRRSGSKLGTEMMRTNSRGSVVSTTEDSKDQEPDVEATASGETTPAALGASSGLESGIERFHVNDEVEVLEALPEDPEKEDMCTPIASLESKALGYQQMNIPTFNTTPGDDVFEPSAESKGVTPPSSSPNLDTKTPESERQNVGLSLDGDTEVTPKPFIKSDGSMSELTDTTELETEPTPRASDRNKSGTRERVMGWMRR